MPPALRHVYISSARESAKDKVLAEQLMQHLTDDYNLRVFVYALSHLFLSLSLPLSLSLSLAFFGVCVYVSAHALCTHNALPSPLSLSMSHKCMPSDS